MPRTSPAPRIQLTVASPTRPAGERNASRGPSLPWLAAATLGSLASLVLGWAVVGAAIVIGWVSAPTILPATAFEAIGQAWLGVHLVPYELAGMKLNLLPLGMTGLVGLALAAVSGYAYSQVDADQRRRPWTTSVLVAGVCTLTYALGAMLVATVVGTNDQVVACLRGAIAVAGIGSVLGTLQVSRPRIPRSPAWVDVLPDAAGSGVVTLLGLSLLGLIVAVISHATAVAAYARDLAPDVVGGVLVTLIHLIYLPNLLAWTGSYLTGAGFYAASDVLLTPTRGGTGPVPTLPVSGALPLVPPAVGQALWASGVIAGVIAGAYLVRRTPTLHRARVASNAARGACAGMVAAVAWCVLAWFSHGSLGSGRLALVGPRFPELLLYAGGEMAIGGALGAAVASAIALRRVAATDAKAAAERASHDARAASRAAKRSAVLASVKEQTSRPLHPAVEARLRAASARRRAQVVPGAVVEPARATQTPAPFRLDAPARAVGRSEEAAQPFGLGTQPRGLAAARPAPPSAPFGLDAADEGRPGSGPDDRPFGLDAQSEPAQSEPVEGKAPVASFPFGLDEDAMGAANEVVSDAQPFGLG